MAAARDYIVEQVDSQGLRWPRFNHKSRLAIQHHLCFGLAVEAQHQGNFEVVEQEDASTANPAPIPSAAQTTLPISQRAQNTTIDPALANNDPVLLLLSNHSNQNSDINDLLARLAQLVITAPNANQAVSLPSC